MHKNKMTKMDLRKDCCKKRFSSGKESIVDITDFWECKGFCDEYCFYSWVIKKLCKT